MSVKAIEVTVRADTAELAERKVKAYLPDNYEIAPGTIADETFSLDHYKVIVTGEDSAGWTAEGYVIPRLGSGMMGARLLFEPTE